MKVKELRSLSVQELIAKEKSLRDELSKLNQQRYGGNVEKPHMFKIIRKDIARINTLLKASPNAEVRDSITAARDKQKEK